MGKIKAISTASTIEVTYETIAKERKQVQCEYVGCSQRDFIIIRYPSSMAPVSDRDPFSAGHVIQVRAVVNLNSQESIHFSSSILKTITTSEQLLIITYPETVESKVMRAEPRLTVELMADIHFEDETKPMLCLIKDVSPSGIGCEFHMKNEHDNQNVEEFLNKKCTLDVDMSIYGVNEVYNFSAIIKNISKKEKIQLGLFFDDENQKQLGKLFEKLAIENALY